MVQNTHTHRGTQTEREIIVKTDINVAVGDAYHLFLVDATVRSGLHFHVLNEQLIRTQGLECYYLLRNKRAIAFDNNVFSRAVHRTEMRGMGEWYSIISA